eukprot:CAMPEP_0196589516 /NCGR_PEP_ID=MMETSP1081-20130531/63769_1 /TAXON_ID=36882 /ORGANISM="Pyramimonas amylifera, Strain CCMP720" /LENGTH=96 /DNA_ID=CAMNT_0041912343 /DNA_START=390 /DNA_END=676 /DNA_ORIENTATION=+
MRAECVYAATQQGKHSALGMKVGIHMQALVSGDLYVKHPNIPKGQACSASGNFPYLLRYTFETGADWIGLANGMEEAPDAPFNLIVTRCPERTPAG